ncbi:MAG TPA: glycosyltransferase [Syntrophobacteraceae bacterium]|nr:glycosyltransferase [Syntrophobacteraceae bacterium]
MDSSDLIETSIVIPVRDRPDLLVECLRAIGQQSIDFARCEVIVCDDGSQENIRGAVQSWVPFFPHFKLVRQRPLGPAAARNLGIRNSGGEIVVFVDSDVLPEKEMVRQLVEYLKVNSSWMGAEAALIPCGKGSGPLWDAPVSVEGGRFHTAAIAYRRGALVRAGGFDEEFKFPACEDVDLAARVLEQGVIGFVPGAVARHPRRRITLRTHWRGQRHWKYAAILAARYGFSAFPEKSAGVFPRLRIALSAVVTFPTGRFLTGLKYMRHSLAEGSLACAFALFDVLCGLIALPDILISRIPERRTYIESQ